MNTYAKLFASLVHSTIWREPDHVRIVWVTMLAIADRHGQVAASVPGLADVSRVPVELCRDALGKLSSPDPDSRSKEYEGRRIAEMPGGWLILNYVRHRDVIDKECIREQTRLRVANYRAKKRTEVTPEVTLKRKCNTGVPKVTTSDKINSTHLISDQKETTTDLHADACSTSGTTKPEKLARETWLTPYGRIWCERWGAECEPPYGAMTQPMKQAEAKVGVEESHKRFRIYVARCEEIKFCKPRWFVEGLGQWTEKAINSQTSQPGRRKRVAEINAETLRLLDSLGPNGGVGDL